MTLTHLDSDRFADVAHGRAAWSPGELAHLERCESCRLESRISLATARLGGEPAAALELEAVAARVRRDLAGLPVESGLSPVAPRRRLVRPILLGLAAAAAIAVAVLLPERPAAPVPVEQLAVLHELDDLSAAELEAVLETLPPPADAMVHQDETGISALSAEALERMLRTME
jgi:hypothetical protein